MVYFIWVDKSELLKDENKGYNFLWANVKKDNRWQRAHIFIYIWRRMSLVLMGFWLVNYPGLQVQIILYFNVFMIIFIAHFKPLPNANDNNSEVKQDAFLLLAAYHLILFTDYV